jgi:hypothetical protein
MEKQNILSGSDSFKSSLGLKMGLLACNPFSYFNTSVFLIRQSIELRIKNALGINYIHHEDGSIIKFPGDKLMDFIFSKPEIELPDIKKSILKKIHEWTQYFVHGGYILNLWQIDIAHTLLLPFFTVGEKDGSMSIHGSIRIKKEYYESSFRSDVKTFVDENLFSSRKENDKKSFHIVEMEPEALIY